MINNDNNFENILLCDGFEPGDYALTEEECIQITAKKRDKLYDITKAATVGFAIFSAVLLVVFKFNESFFDANSRIGIKMESMNAQENKYPVTKINIKTSFKDEQKSRLVIPLSAPIDNDKIKVCEEFTQDKYVITLSEYSQNVQNGMELVSDSAIMEAVGAYRQNNDVVVEVYCRDSYDCEMQLRNNLLTVNFKETGEQYAAKAVVWLPFEDKNRLALPEWKQQLKKFASDNNIRLYMASEMQEEYTQSDVIAFANRIDADMVLGVEVQKTDAQQSYMTGSCNTMYFIPDYNSAHLAVVMAESFVENTQIAISGFEAADNYLLVSEATVPSAVVRLSITKKDMESVENEYKLNGKITLSLENTMEGILENYLKVKGETNES